VIEYDLRSGALKATGIKIALIKASVSVMLDTLTVVFTQYLEAA